MKLVNLSAIIVKPKQPYWDWVNNLDDEPISPESLSSEHPVYLLPECDSDAQFQLWLKKNYLTIFENELHAWWQDDNDWPVVRDYKTFRAWFEIQYGSEVFDMSEKPLLTEK